MSLLAGKGKAQLDLFAAGDRCDGAESFDVSREGSHLVRAVRLASGNIIQSEIRVPAGMTPHGDLAAAYDLAWLRSEDLPPQPPTRRELRYVDLFSGCGGLSLGIHEACRALAINPQPVLAVDLATDALDVYSINFPGAKAAATMIESLLDGDIGSKLSSSEAAFKSEVGRIDLVVGGPPCQGHSDLNNHSRRDDPKNALYLRMARCAEVLEPEHLVIENVPGVIHDRGDVVSRTRSRLEQLGYSVSDGVLHAAELGVPQRRKRHILVASRAVRFGMDALPAAYGCLTRTVDWAIRDLERSASGTLFDTAARHSEENRRRINYLFEKDLHDLPDEQRPDCHRLKSHSYKAVYGRLRWDVPAPTITSGFGSTGQGRFVHPGQRRTLTPHEAARIQFFPDFFNFGPAGRRSLQSMIGNAVPSKLGYVVMLELLRSGSR